MEHILHNQRKSATVFVVDLALRHITMLFRQIFVYIINITSLSMYLNTGINKGNEPHTTPSFTDNHVLTLFMWISTKFLWIIKGVKLNLLRKQKDQ
jgi:hypothetical protein